MGAFSFRKIEKFLIRQEVLKAFKQIIKSANRIDDASYRKYMIDWARHDFKANKNLSDEVCKHGHCHSILVKTWRN